MSGGNDPAGPGPGPSPPGAGLDPDLAAARRRAAAPAPASPPPPAIDPRRYGWMIGGFGVIVVVVISVITLSARGPVTTGVPPHHRLRFFAAPLASSNLNGDANVAHPTCSLARHDPRALNVCLLVARGPLVLGFFVTGGAPCVRAIDAMQTISSRFPSVQFAAVAIGAGHTAAARVVRARKWTIPVAYDPDGAVGYQYGVDACPLIELAYRGGIVRDRLIGEHWAHAAALAGRVRALISSGPAR